MPSRNSSRRARSATWGVSNLDPDDMKEFLAAKGGAGVQTNQVLYNPSRRGIEFDLLPMLRARKIPIMAYSPIEQGRILTDRTLVDIARRHGATPAQVALAWALRDGGVIAIPKAADMTHVRDNRAALDIELTHAGSRRHRPRLPAAEKGAALGDAVTQRRPASLRGE